MIDAMARRRIAVGQVLVDQKKGQRIVAVEAEAKATAPLVEIGEQPALVMQILNVFDRCFKGRIVLRRPRRNTFVDQLVDTFDELSLVSGKAEIHVFCTLSPNCNCRKLFVQLLDETGFVQFSDKGIVDKLLGLGGFAGGIQRKIQHRLHARG